jgi:EAL and modified HD-GYP domain-containing signal transduction protein
VPDGEVIAAVRRLRDRGFTIALDDFEGGEDWDPLLKMARTVKLDVLNVPVATLAERVRRLKRYPVRLLAERIEDDVVFKDCVQLGFDFFQGYHFRKPEVVQRRTLPVAMTRVVKLMAMINDPNVSDAAIEQEMRSDPGLSVKLLRIVNNASTGVREVASIGHAIRLAGRRTIYQWLALLLVSTVPTGDDVAREAVLVSLERGRFCELLALGTGRRDQADPLFLVGLLSDLDVILGVDKDELIGQLGVSGDVAAALRGQPGPHTDYLRVATAYANGEWEQLSEASTPLGVEEALPEWYGEAGGWAREVLKAR